MACIFNMLLGAVPFTTVAIACLVLLLMTICALCDSVRYRIKFAVFILVSAVSTTIHIPFMLYRIRSWKNALFPARYIAGTAKFLGINYILRGKENIVKDDSCVVLINHQSAVDLIVLAELWPVLERCTVIAKKAVLYFGTFGLATWLWGTIFIDRLNVEEAHKTINKAAATINSNKSRLLMFPEGKRYSGTSLMPFKKGAFHVAIAAQAPIQPVVVSRYYFFNDKLKKFDSGISYITILPPIPTKGLTKNDLPDLLDKVYDLMNKKFVETSQEALTEHMNHLQREH